MGYSEILKEELKGTSNDIQESADNILTSSRHLLDLINDILDLSRAERGTLELSIENTSVPEIIGDTVSIIKDIASKKNVIIKQELDKELEYIEADKKRLKQILINLFANSVKYNKAEGGIVTIRTRKNGNMAEFSIGLAFTKYLVELHDGKIRAESKFGEGSTFTFTLPLIAKKEIQD
jgi:signal transduction histidine kinase